MITINRRIRLLGVKIDNISKKEVLEIIVEIIQSNKKAIIANVNLHAINISYENLWFRKFLNESQIVFCDGVGVQLAAKLTSQKLDFRFTPPDWIDELCSIFTTNQWGMFLLGSKQEITEGAANQLRQTHPGVEISTHHGYFKKSGLENEAVVNLINQSNAKILFVGMGMPLQEQWIQDNFNKLSEVKICMPVGALFDYVAKETPRGPSFLTNHGFEWLTRLIIEPKRLWSRYLIGIPLVLFRVLKHHYFHKPDLTK